MHLSVPERDDDELKLLGTHCHMPLTHRCCIVRRRSTVDGPQDEEGDEEKDDDDELKLLGTHCHMPLSHRSCIVRRHSTVDGPQDEEGDEEKYDDDQLPSDVTCADVV